MTKPTIKRVGGPAWVPGEPVLTVSEIAERLRPIAPDVAGTVQKIRYWTRYELMLPVAQGHAGTGKHRQYAASQVFDAAVLYVMARAGLTVSASRLLTDALTQSRFRLVRWLEAKRRGHELPATTLYIWQTGGLSGHGFDPPEAAPELLITIDLGQVWSKVIQ